VRICSLVLLFALVTIPHSVRADLSDVQIRSILINKSLSAYPGNCPCPYNVDRAGRHCGARSAYSKPGGRSPICFETDVTTEMIRAYRDRQP
jgi:hypothetical protein